MIGIFDSGSGGLTVLRALRKVLPSCDVVYFGDIKNAPYGSRSQEELSNLTVHALELLRTAGASKIISACNSTSASLALSIFDAFGIEPNNLIEMVGPTVSYFKGSDARVLLCATPATVRSGIYQNAFGMIGLPVTAREIPALAGSIEFGKPKGEIQKNIRDALASINLAQFDVLVLACTHYPLALEEFRAVVPTSLQIFDPAIAVAERAYQQFWPQEVHSGQTRFLVSAPSPQFNAVVTRLFGDKKYTIEVVQ